MYANIRRWHFYAGLFCLPFVVWLSLTGAFYLFRPQVEAMIDAPYAHVAAPDAPHGAPSAQVATAVRAVPGSVLHRYQLPATREQAVQILVGRGAGEMRVYVDPQRLTVVKTVAEDQRLMRIVFRLHGELLAGPLGSYLVELAASWTILMILTGLFLWWPRGRGLAGTLYPRLGQPRVFWRDLHAVTGLWVSFAALALLLSGLPWAVSWGSYLKAIRAVAEGQAPRQDWSTGRADELRTRAAADAGTRAMMGDHAEHGGMTMAHQQGSYAALDRIVAAVRPLRLAGPVLIAPPTAPGGAWTAKSDAADRPLRTDLTLDAATGRVLTRRDFGERKLVDRIVGYGVAAHEGQLFGWVNQLVNLLTAIGLVMLSVSSIVLWWRRRPQGVLGAPPVGRRRVGLLWVAIIALGLALPLFGASLIAVLLVERLVIRRIPPASRWLGLRLARPSPQR
ncbi:putative iron-regulated membrane protein [Sphingomonas jinjuensis]|uniref:Putative iron-regulated membrane protein n=1 Tax=Sphingomonas jinjuensis TaxID=535907 RepID=A0A840FBA2_9SPHN|nr:PepSY domain-containing protein [Sphingomonas jinjuensis]MBB4154939.1 putative iron-regulated membrane protein [Sphingomonas jinjuensis]